MSNARKIKRPGFRDGAHQFVADGNLTHIRDKSGRPVGSMDTADLDIRDGVVHLKSSRVQVPGLSGTFEGGCVGCMRPTDTCLGLIGCPDFMAAVLMMWGASEDGAYGTLQAGLDDDRRHGHKIMVVRDADDRIIATGHSFRVCATCAGKTNMAPHLAIGTQVPHYPEPAAFTAEFCDHPAIEVAP